MAAMSALSPRDLDVTLRTAAAVLLSPPPSVAPDAALRASYGAAAALDRGAATVPPDAVAGCLAQLRVLRGFVRKLTDAGSSIPLDAALAEAVAGAVAALRELAPAPQTGDTSSDSESSESGASLTSASRAFAARIFL